MTDAVQQQTQSRKGKQPESSDTRQASSFVDFWRGWRVIILGSWLNGLLVLFPVSCILQVTAPQADVVIFILCILAMIPLVKLHDLATCELALRIGGSKTGLIKASLNNVVGLVIAVSALRKCELRVVQSSLIGSILSGLLLVLGMGLFAGGLRFSDQYLDFAATQVQASLLSVSVSVLLLPAAYHFALSGGGLITEEQKRDILRMSHGCSIILLAIHFSYMLFQLWSHTHLYQDVDNSDKIISGKRAASPRSFVPPTCFPWYAGSRADLEKHAESVSCSRTSSSSSVAMSPPHKHSFLQTPESSSDSLVMKTGLHPGVQFNSVSSISAPSQSVKMVPTQHTAWLERDNSSATLPVERIPSTSSLLGSETHGQTEQFPTFAPLDDVPVPLLSWPMGALLLVSVTILVAINADWLVNSMKGSVSTVIRKQWIALILLPSVSSAAECVSAMNVSFKDQLPLSVSVAVGSTIQTTLFVIPFTVTLAWVLGKPLALLFDPFESVVLYISVQTMGHVVARGRSSWLEGVELICLYVIIAVAFWYYPVSDISSTLAVCTTTP